MVPVAFVANTPSSLQATLAVEAHPAEQFLVEGQTVKKKISVMPSNNSKPNSFQKKRAEFRAKVVPPLASDVQILSTLFIYGSTPLCWDLATFQFLNLLHIW
jgi:hypothetical protein